MADLLDIAPSTAVGVVWLDDQRITVRCISVNAMAAIIARYKGLKSLAGGGFGDDIIMRLLEGFGEAAAAIIAAGCGHPGNEKYEQHAATLLPEQQLKLLGAIVAVTFPNGLGPFVQELTNLIGGPGEKAKVHKIRLRKSPSPSQPSSDEDSRQTMQ